MAENTIPLALYMWRRIHSIGIRTIMGLPGDFNLNWLDYLYDVPGLSWAGNANELNAAYAADGYARIKKVPGCIVTTHGVGELSAMNGIAAAASENVPVVHIVGQTLKNMQENNLMIHHSIGTKPDHQLYNKMSEHIRCAAAELWDPKEAPAEIDRVLRECVIQQLPVYIFFPLDLTQAQVPAAPLATPIDLSRPVNHDNEKAALDAVWSELSSAQSPSVFVDHLAARFARDPARFLVDALQLPTYAAHMGKAVVDEDHACFVGLYNGAVGLPGTAAAIEASDLVLALGWFETDSNSAAFSRKLPADRRIDIQPSHVSVRGKAYNNVYMAPFLEKLTKLVTASRSKLPQVSIPKLPSPNLPAGSPSSRISQDYIWTRLGSFLRPNDVLLVDTGTAAFGFPDATFPRNTRYVCQTYYGSIGFATPAALGADLALQELHEESDGAVPRGRTVLVTGDGSIQLTMQEVGTMVARGARVIVFVINNSGYTIERVIHGARQHYNDITPYDWSQMLRLFRHPRAEQNFKKLETKEDVETALGPAVEGAVDKLAGLVSKVGVNGSGLAANGANGQGEADTLASPKSVHVLEVIMDRMDAPWRLVEMLRIRLPDAEAYLRKEGFIKE